MEAARPAEAADEADLARLVAEARAAVAAERGGERWLAREGHDDFRPDRLLAALDRPDHRVLVGTCGGAVVGYLHASLADPPGSPARWATIHELFVEPGGREVGVGEALMDAVLAWAEASGCTGIDSFALPGNRAMKNLFERYGLVARAILVHRPLGGAP